MDGALFLSRLWDLDQYEANCPDNEDKWRDRISTLGSRLQLIHASPSSFNAGLTIGRACLYVQHNGSADFTRGIITIGGFRANIIESFAGVLLGQATAAPRTDGEPFANDELIEWAQGQDPMVMDVVQDREHLAEYSEIVRICRAHTGDLPLALSHTGWLTAHEIEELARHRDEFFIMEPVKWKHWQNKHKDQEWILEPSVILAQAGRSMIFRGVEEYKAPMTTTDHEARLWFHRKTIYGAVLEAIARGWQIPLEQLIEPYNQYTARPEGEEHIVGRFGDQLYKDHVAPSRRP